jgi:hypothetical protein
MRIRCQLLAVLQRKGQRIPHELQAELEWQAAGKMKLTSRVLGTPF